MRTKKSQININLARAIAEAIGFNPIVYPHFDDDNSNSIDILECTDPLDTENRFFCTIGLSDIPVKILNEEQDFGVEILIVAKKNNEFASSLLSSCSFFIGKDNWEARPGAVFNDLITLYEKNLEMKHVYFTEAFLWQDKLEQISSKIKEKNVLFLLAVPISESELSYKNKDGDEEFEKLLFFKNDIDLFDFNRKSVI
jgi:antitoxin YqcF